MIGLAVVFDGAGVIYAPFRIIKDMQRGLTKRSRVSGITCTDRLTTGAMVILETRYEETLEQEEPTRYFAEVLQAREIETKVIYKREGVSDEEIRAIILQDRSVTLRDVHEVVRKLRRCDILPVLGIGLILEMDPARIRYVIAGGINLFPGTLKLFKELRELGIQSYIASGDRIEREEMAIYLPDVPPEHMYGTMKPEDKRDLVRSLKKDYRVMMVGDDRNDYLAMRDADLAVLSLQEAASRPQEVFDVADFRVKDIGEVREIVEELRG